MSWKSKEERHCIDCGKKGIAERRRCLECSKKYNRERSKEMYNRLGRHHYGIGTCSICGKSMKMWRKTQATHISCRPKTADDYNLVGRAPTGRTVGRKKMIDNGVKVPDDFVVHHLDENPDNNNISNLVALSRSSHNSLHRTLQYHRSLFLKENSKNSEDCWKPLRDHLTKAWLETTNAKVLKIDGIGKSAAEPLNSDKEHEEGSEAMHGTPKSYG